MKSISIITLLVLTLVILSCESPLSEEGVSDPSLIQPKIQVQMESDYKGSTYFRYRCKIYDKDLKAVELKGGGVKVNNYNMILIKDVLGSYYLLDDSQIKYELNTNYNFTITLSDLSQYYATVTTHSDSIREFIVPIKQSKTKNMEVTWKGYIDNSLMYFTVTSYFQTDTTKGINTHRVEIPKPSLGMFELQNSDFIYKDGNTYMVDLTLHSEIDGTIDNRFYVNRRAFSHQLITKTIEIIE